MTLVTARRPAPPAGFELIETGCGSFGFVRPEVAELVAGELERAGTLEQACLDWADAVGLGGRGAIQAARPPAAGGADAPRWVVRPYLRGGWMARVLHDRHLALGPWRPWTEALAIEALERSGVPTVRVIAGVVHPLRGAPFGRGVWYRAELVTEFVAGTRTLADLLFESDTTESQAVRCHWLAEAARTCRDVASAGVLHRDLNARNLLLDGDRLRVIDLDQARRGVTAVAPAQAAMVSRLARSLRKFEGHTGHLLSATEWRAFNEPRD